MLVKWNLFLFCLVMLQILLIKATAKPQKSKGKEKVSEDSHLHLPQLKFKEKWYKKHSLYINPKNPKLETAVANVNLKLLVVYYSFLKKNNASDIDTKMDLHKQMLLDFSKIFVDQYLGSTINMASQEIFEEDMLHSLIPFITQDYIVGNMHDVDRNKKELEIVENVVKEMLKNGYELQEKIDKINKDQSDEELQTILASFEQIRKDAEYRIANSPGFVWYNRDDLYKHICKRRFMLLAIETVNLELLAIYYSSLDHSKKEKRRIEHKMEIRQKLFIKITQDFLKKLSVNKKLDYEQLRGILRKFLINSTVFRDILTERGDKSNEYILEKIRTEKRVQNLMLKKNVMEEVQQLKNADSETLKEVITLLLKLKKQQSEEEAEKQLSENRWYDLDEFFISGDFEYNTVICGSVFKFLALYASSFDENDEESRKKIATRKKNLMELCETKVTTDYIKNDFDTFKDSFNKELVANNWQMIEHENKDLTDEEICKIKSREFDLFMFRFYRMPETEDEANQLLASLRIKRKCIEFIEELKSRCMLHIQASASSSSKSSKNKKDSKKKDSSMNTNIERLFNVLKYDLIRDMLDHLDKQNLELELKERTKREIYMKSGSLIKPQDLQNKTLEMLVEQLNKQKKTSDSLWYDTEDYAIDDKYDERVKEHFFKLLAVYVSGLDMKDKNTKKKIKTRKEEIYKLSSSFFNTVSIKWKDAGTFNKELYELCISDMDTKIEKENVSLNSKEIKNIQRREHEMLTFYLEKYPQFNDEADQLLSLLRIKRETINTLLELQKDVSAIYASILTQQEKKLFSAEVAKQEEAIESLFQEFLIDIKEEKLEGQTFKDIEEQVKENILITLAVATMEYINKKDLSNDVKKKEYYLTSDVTILLLEMAIAEPAKDKLNVQRKRRAELTKKLTKERLHEVEIQNTKQQNQETSGKKNKNSKKRKDSKKAVEIKEVSDKQDSAPVDTETMTDSITRSISEATIDEVKTSGSEPAVPKKEKESISLQNKEKGLLKEDKAKLMAHGQKHIQQFIKKNKIKLGKRNYSFKTMLEDKLKKFLAKKDDNLEMNLLDTIKELDDLLKQWTETYVPEKAIKKQESISERKHSDTCKEQLEKLEKDFLSDILTNNTNIPGLIETDINTKHKFVKEQLPIFIKEKCSSINDLENVQQNFSSIFNDWLVQLNNLRIQELNTQMQDHYKKTKQTLETFEMKEELKNKLFNVIEPHFPESELFITGSTLNGFGSESSDMDLTLITHEQERDFYVLWNILNLLNDTMMDESDAKETEDKIIIAHKQDAEVVRGSQDTKIIDKQQLITKAAVPILKISFKGKYSDMQVDLSVNSETAIRNTHLLWHYKKFDWRVAPLVSVVKAWAKSREINSAFQMTLSSYSLVLMVIHYLQSGTAPPILPDLEQMFSSKLSKDLPISQLKYQAFDVEPQLWNFNETEDVFVSRLLLGFLHYYAYEFNFEKHKIKIQMKSDPKEQEAKPKDSAAIIYIEEPFTHQNTAFSSYALNAFKRILHHFQTSFEELYINMDLNSFLRLSASNTSDITRRR